ncbi:MAG TPA: FAD-dependent oxidoreductase [Pseudonocardia sp.]|jgi:ferredoxin--NADP+ reductase|nr:FAD-dependent oxidoreductase [Pseudonocardia sp.]
MDAVTNPLTVAIVGSGPSGFYAAGALLDNEDLDVRVDMFERLATPWGLVRFGVAPDHPKIKSVSSVYAKIAAQESFRFFGNVEVGATISHGELTERYDAVIYAIGTQGGRQLGVPGEDLPGSEAAVDFVGWYNGHPDYADREFDLSSERAVVVGAGNVALDVARILCSPYDRLVKTDIADHALQALRDSNITEVLVVARRGPAQVAFTTPELKELPEFTASGVDVRPDEVADSSDDDSLSKVAKRNLGVMREYAKGETELGERHISLRFLRSPVELRGDGKVEQIVLGRNELRTGEDGWVSARDTGEREIVDTGLVLRAVGYHGVAVDGLPFDERRGVIPNEKGRVVDSEREYVVGWIKRGPTGIIGTNKKDAVETVNQLLEDLSEGRLQRHERDATIDVEDWLTQRQPKLVTEQGWQLIDAAERKAGEPTGRPRVKMCNLDDMLAVALGESHSGS